MKAGRYTQYMYSYPHKTAYRPLSRVSLEDYAPLLAGGGHGLYLHIPFCESKCGYCNLFSIAGGSREDIDRYLDAAERQIAQYDSLFRGGRPEFQEFTVGGGTPLLLTENQLERMFSMVLGRFHLEEGARLIIETAPNQTTKKKLDLLKEAGITRVSMGVQSFFEKELAVLRRGHSAARARRALELIAAEQFECVNVDLIYGVPGQTEATFLESVKQALEFWPEEIFIYPLYVKHGASLERELGRGFVLDEELAFRQYEKAAELLASSGYRQDSMRRFVKKRMTNPPWEEGENREFNDCGFGSILSLGCGGRSYIGNLHFCTPYGAGREQCARQLEEYEGTADYRRVRHGFLLSEEEQKRRYVMKHLLIMPGLDKETYRSHFQTEAAEDFPLLYRWAEQGYLEEGSKYFSLTPLGLGWSDLLGPQLMSEEVAARMKEWEEIHGMDHGSISGKPEKL